MSTATVQANPISTNFFTHTAYAPSVISSRQVLPTIESTETGTPELTIRQSDTAQLVAQLPNLEQNRSLIEKLYHNTRIDTRHLTIKGFADK